MTKRFFPYIFFILLVGLGYMIYSHWYAPDRPVAYYPPAENQIPDHMESLTLVDINDNKRTIHMKDAPYTLLGFVVHIPEFNEQESYYEYLSDRRDAYPNARLIFLWNVSEDGTISHIRKVAKNKKLDRNILSNRLRVEYHKSKNLDVVSVPTFLIYDREGNLVLQTTSPTPDELGAFLQSLQ